MVEFDWGDFAFLFSGAACQVADGGANLFDFGVSELNGIENGVFFNFLRARFDHYYCVGAGDNHQTQKAFVDFLVSRVDHELAIDETDSNCANRAIERNIGQREGRGGGVDGEDVGIVFGIGGED